MLMCVGFFFFLSTVVSFIYTHICDPQNVCDKREKQRWTVKSFRNQGGGSITLSRRYRASNDLILNLSWSNITLTLRFGLCDNRQQLPKSLPGSDGWECCPVWRSKGQLTDLARQGPGASQAWLRRWTPYAHHGTSRTILVFSSSHLPGTAAIPCTYGASSSPAPP